MDRNTCKKLNLNRSRCSKLSIKSGCVQMCVREMTPLLILKKGFKKDACSDNLMHTLYHIYCKSIKYGYSHI